MYCMTRRMVASQAVHIPRIVVLHIFMNRIPNLTELRTHKPGYDTRVEIDTGHPLHNDPLVDPREAPFGFEDASSYYSRPNRMTGERLPGVPDAPLIRLDVAKRLVIADQFLRTDPDVREALGAPARIRIDDALRPHQVQKFAFEVAWPMVIKSANPDMSDEDVRREVPNYCARPSDKPTPTPHLTGGAVDVALINLETGKPFDRGHRGGAVKGTAYPDFHEGYHLTEGQSDIVDSPEQTAVEPEGSEVVLGRRALYYAMTGPAGLYINPQEIWHYGKGDPLSEYVSGNNKAYYGIADIPGWYEAEMSNLSIDLGQ
jgi:D-alanyl-D-alanine dipeptidase